MFAREQPPALRTRCQLCEDEIATTAGAVLLDDDRGSGVAHGRCWRVLRSRRRRRRLTGSLLVATAILALASLWALGGGRYGLAVALTAAAGLCIFAAVEIER